MSRSLRSPQVFTALLLLLAAPGPALALSPIEELGRALFFDTNLSVPPGLSCAACHAPETGFTGANSEINATQVAYPGAVHNRAGGRKPPTAAYGGYSPVLYYDEARELFIGGMFWDGRATGWTLGDPLAEQALGPFLNPLEQNVPNAQLVCRKVARSGYRDLFEQVWGPGSVDPVKGVPLMYERIGRSIAAYESSLEVNPFTSKYDYYLEGLAELTGQEALGLQLFEGKAMCANCHTAAPGGEGMPPLFTDYSYDNLGLPRNPDLVFYTATPRINPEGVDWIDPGLGGFLATMPGFEDMAEANLGKHKVPTLRNVDLRPYPGFVKAFGHNGYFKSLEDITHFYNTRDVVSWPAPEVPETVNGAELGHLGLTADEEAAVVAFMKTLSDGWVPTPDKAPAAGAASPLKLNWLGDARGAGNLSFSLPKDGSVRLDVYNLRGQRVARLADGWYGAGEHAFTLQEDLASGVYLARVVAGGDIATRKFSIVR